MTFCLPEQLKVVSGLPPTVGSGGALIGDYVSLKNLQKLYIIMHYHQGDATQITFNPKRATAVAGTAAAVFTETCRIWANEDAEASDTLVEKTAAVNYQGDANQKHKIIIFEVDPDLMTDTFDCVCGETTTNVANTSWLEILYIGVPRYPGRASTAPTVITD